MTWLKDNKLVQKFLNNLNSGKLSTNNQITLFTSIHDFLKNGFTLKEAFSFCSTVHPELEDAITVIKRSLSNGNSFADGIKTLVNFRTYCQIKIAEYHGDLVKTLGSVSKFLKIKQQQKNKLTELMVYPIFLLILLVGIVITIHLLVTPQFQNLSSGQTEHHYGLWLLISLLPIAIVIYGFWKYWRNQNQIWRINHELKIPVIGKIYQAYCAYYLSSNLALMMKCGMDLQQIVKFMMNFKSNPLILKFSQDVKQVINQGNNLRCLKSKYHFLPKQMMMLIDNGDTTNVLAQKLNAYSKLEFKSMVKQSTRLISMLQPIMFLIIGLLIVGTYLSMLLPMYSSIRGIN